MSAYSGPRLQELPRHYALKWWMDDHLDMTSLYSPEYDANAGYRALEQDDTNSALGIRYDTLELLNQVDLLPDIDVVDGYRAGLDEVKRAIFPGGHLPTEDFLAKLAHGDIPDDLALRREHLGFHSSSMMRAIALYDTRGPDYSRTYVPFNVAEGVALGKPIGIVYYHETGHWCGVPIKPGARLPQPCLLCWKECAPTIAASAAHRRIHQEFSFWQCVNLPPEERQMDCGCIEDSSNPPSLMTRRIEYHTV